MLWVNKYLAAREWVPRRQQTKTILLPTSTMFMDPKYTFISLFSLLLSLFFISSLFWRRRFCFLCSSFEWYVWALNHEKVLAALGWDAMVRKFPISNFPPSSVQELNFWCLFHASLFIVWYFLLSLLTVKLYCLMEWSSSSTLAFVSVNYTLTRVFFQNCTRCPLFFSITFTP